MKKYDILCLEWGTKIRDSNIVSPISMYLKEEYGYKIKRSSIAYGVIKLVVYHPKMLMMANFSGAPENVRIFKNAYRLGIKTVSLISEGDVVDDPKRVEGFFWGWDFEKKCYLDLFLLWSERSRRIFEKYIPESHKINMKVSGATGFDRYNLLKDTFMSRENFCSKYQKKYSKIIGITSFGFSQVFADKTNNPQKDFYIKSCLELRKILKETIQYFGDVLFVLRPHPGEISDENEFFGLENLENVIFIQGKDETIADNINVCDIWIAYESTTCLEAWLLGKTTLLVNPFLIEDSRSIVHSGSPIACNRYELISYIEEFYKYGKVEDFENLKMERERIILNVIGYDDGKNYIRAAREIDAVMNSEIRHRKRITIDFLYELIKDIVKWIGHHSLLKNYKMFKRDAVYYHIFNEKEFQEEEKEYYTAIYGKTNHNANGELCK